MKTWQFAFNGRAQYIDARNIFDAMVEFHALHEGIEMDQLIITAI